MNAAANPCENFFDYACGQWIRDNPIPEDKSGYGMFALVNDKILQQMRGTFFCE